MRTSRISRKIAPRKETFVAQASCLWGQRATCPLTVSSPTRTRISPKRFTIHGNHRGDLTTPPLQHSIIPGPNGAQPHPPFHRHRNLGARGTSSFPAAKSRRPCPRCRRPDRIGFGLAAGTPHRRVALRYCLVRPFGRTCFSSEPRVGHTLPIPPVRLGPSVRHHR